MRMTEILSEEEATGRAKEVYEDIQKNFGMVPNFFKVQGAVDPDWMEMNWNRVKKIMLAQRALDRKTKELIALTVSLLNHCEYCALAHETMAIMSGATDQEINETRKVIELFASFNSIADSLRIPPDINPEMAQKA
jgi:AhpD family alkylhydroperoxidase